MILLLLARGAVCYVLEEKAAVYGYVLERF